MLNRELAKSDKPTIGMIGLGKLGLPIAVAVANRGFKVCGHDIRSALMRKRLYEHKELGPMLKNDFQKYFDEANLDFCTLPDLIDKCDIIFVAVQTPHEVEHGGTKRTQKTKRDFNYTYLKDCCGQISQLRPAKEKLIVIISTVLPGTVRREILPFLPNVVYNPAFPAMGTVIWDYLHPEFVLIGGDDSKAIGRLMDFYYDLIGSDTLNVIQTSIESAELIKVSYNLFISFKIGFINTLAEVAHKIPNCNIDTISDALCMSNRRLLSPAYLRGGMGDGGACHPRDAIAMSHLMTKLNISNDPFHEVMSMREGHAEWLVNLFLSHAGDLPKALLGKSYKPESNILDGSPALLIAELLKERGKLFEHLDPYTDYVPEGWLDLKPRAYLITTKHDVFKNYLFAPGSIVIDPFRYIPRLKDVKIVQVGVGK